jgi:hypothetical protein
VFEAGCPIADKPNQTARQFHPRDNQPPEHLKDFAHLLLVSAALNASSLTLCGLIYPCLSISLDGFGTMTIGY